METCTAVYETLASQVGGIDCAGSPVVTFRSPFALDSGTMPIIEVVLVVGTVYSLVHALRRRRRYGDSTNLIVWLAAIVSPLFIETVAYFPQWFGLEEQVGLTFIHNQFSATFLYNRLPIYVFGMYAAFACPLYSLVQRAGIVQRCRPVVTASVVAFLFVVLYELIDQLGPQLEWWVWNDAHPALTARFGVTPLTSLAGFSAAVPFAITFGTIVMSRRRPGIALNVLIVAVMLWPVILISVLPRQILEGVGVSPAVAQWTSTVLVVAVLVVGTVVALVAVRQPDGPGGSYAGFVPDPRDPCTLISLAAYVITGAGIWLYALPEYLDSTSGRSPTGGALGSLPYAVVCTAVGVAVVVAAEAVARRRPAVEPGGEEPDRGGADVTTAPSVRSST